LLAGYFLRRDPPQPVGTAACVWWIGENLVNVSVYMADARDLALPLVGGGDHDWNELFYRFGLLGQESVSVVSGGTRGAGIVVMLLGLLGLGADIMTRGCCWRHRRSAGCASPREAPAPPAPSS